MREETEGKIENDSTYYCQGLFEKFVQDVGNEEKATKMAF